MLLAGNACFTLYTVVGRRACAAGGSLAVVAGAMRYGLMVLAPIAAAELITTGMPTPSPSAVVSLMYLGFGCSATAYALWGYALSRLPAGQVGLLSNVQLVGGLVVAALLAGEAFTPGQLVGVVLVLAGIWFGTSAITLPRLALMSIMSDLAVRSLRVRAVRVPLSRPHPTAGGIVSEAPLVLVDLLTDDGVTGSAYVFCYTPLALTPVARLLANLETVIAGMPLAPLAIERALQARFRLLGPQGLTGIAMAAIDMAAWDAQARAAGLPLVRLLGGEPRPVPVYHSLGMGGVDLAAQEAEASAAAGYRAVKYKIGYPEVRTDLEVICAARRAAGDDLVVMVDYNQSLDVPEAVRRGRLLDNEGIEWIEEPTTADDFVGHAAIAREVATPIQLGENWWGTHDMAKSLAAGASDYVMVDVMKIGGVSGWLRAAALAEPHGIRLSSHLFPELSAHLMAVTPTAHWLEYLDLASSILREPLRIVDGSATAGKSPGSGIDWNEDAVARYLI